MALRATITFERFSKSGRLLERRVQPSRSFLLGLIQLLYVHHSTLSLSSGVNQILLNYTGQGFTLDTHYHNFRVASLGGGAHMPTEGYPLGDEVGIQIGTGTKAVDARDRGLEKRIAPVEGRQLYTIKHPGTGNPYGLAFDNTDFYVVDVVSPQSKIYKFNRYTGDAITSYNAPGDSQYSYSKGLCFDGTYLWCTGRVTVSPYFKVFKLNKDTGAVVAEWFTQFGNRQCNGLAWDGANIWCADSGGTYQLHKCNPADGAIIASITPPYNTGAYYGLAWDGTYLWGVASGGYGRGYGGQMICQINPASGALVKEFLTPIDGWSSAYAYPWGLMWVDGYLWHSDYGGSKPISQLCANKVRFDYAGCEVLDDESYVDPNGSFTIRRYFTNKSGGSITVNEVGINATQRVLAIARDIVSPGVAVAGNQVLKVEYAVQITV